MSKMKKKMSYEKKTFYKKLSENRRSKKNCNVKMVSLFVKIQSFKGGVQKHFLFNAERNDESELMDVYDTRV